MERKKRADHSSPGFWVLNCAQTGDPPGPRETASQDLQGSLPKKVKEQSNLTDSVPMGRTIVTPSNECMSNQLTCSRELVFLLDLSLPEGVFTL